MAVSTPFLATPATGSTISVTSSFTPETVLVTPPGSATSKPPDERSCHISAVIICLASP